MSIEDFDDIITLWSPTEGVSLSEDDTRDRLSVYLSRNQGLSFVAFIDDHIVGTVLCGHYGRRGVLRHLAVAEHCRGSGIARELVNRSIAALARQDIQKYNLYVLDSDPSARSFWQHVGWYELEDDYRTLQTPTGLQDTR
jgi:ribosomal protein S18 acetylase RimI-like enzyme